MLDNSNSFKNSLNKSDYKSDVSIEGMNISVYSSFKFSLPYKEKLENIKHDLVFDKKTVRAFGMKQFDENRTKSINILYYYNDSCFVIRLVPKDTSQEIILYKNEYSKDSTLFCMMGKLDSLIKIGNEEKNIDSNKWKYCIRKHDELIIPVIKFNIETNYETIEGNYFKSKNDNYQILLMKQRTGFMLDDIGAEIESESWFEGATATKQPKDSILPKIMIFDKPFLIVLKKRNKLNPYFVMWVSNNELMENEE